MLLGDDSHRCQNGIKLKSEQQHKLLAAKLTKLTIPSEMGTFTGASTFRPRPLFFFLGGIFSADFKCQTNKQ